MKNLRREKRTQSGLEYLMTYGWGIVVVAVVIAALVLLNNPSLVHSGSFTGFKQNLVVANANFPASGTAPLEFIVSNASGRPLKFSGLKVKYNRVKLGGVTKIDDSYVGVSPIAVPAGANKNVSFYSTSEWFRGPLNLSVDFVAVDADGFPKNSSGSVSFTAVNGSGCPPSCSSRLRRCAPYLINFYQTCVIVSGCMVWDPPTRCDDGHTCSNGQCEPV